MGVYSLSGISSGPILSHHAVITLGKPKLTLRVRGDQEEEKGSMVRLKVFGRINTVSRNEQS